MKNLNLVTTATLHPRFERTLVLGVLCKCVSLDPENGTMTLRQESGSNAEMVVPAPYKNMMLSIKVGDTCWLNVDRLDPVSSERTA